MAVDIVVGFVLRFLPLCTIRTRYSPLHMHGTVDYHIVTSNCTVLDNLLVSGFFKLCGKSSYLFYF